MRPLLLGALLAFVLAPAASAQLNFPMLTIDAVAVGSPRLDPGNGTAVAVTLTRTCPNAATVFTEQVAHVVVLGRANWTVEGPAQVVFPQQVCAQEMSAQVVVSYVVTAPRDAARGEVFPFVAKGRLEAANQATPSSNEASFPFTIGTTDAPPLDSMAEEVVRESPPAAAGLLALALVAAVLLARRR